MGGVDVKDYDLDTLRSSVAMVLQKNELFSSTIKENLRWGNENAADEEMSKEQKVFGNVSAADEMPKMQFDKTALKRLLSYMKEYKRQLVFVVICILLSAVASAASYPRL